MPVPWPVDAKGRPTGRRMYVPEHMREDGVCPIEMKAITRRQLHELQELLIRVCKARLLKGARVFGAQEEVLAWPHVNQHHITAKFLMKVIPEDNSCSFVDMVAERPQKAMTFVSHNWSEPFRDFMVAIEHHCRDVAVRARDAYWVCVYALNQWRPDVGMLIEAGPFVTALKTSGSAVLMLDKKASSLSRLWCLIEINVILGKYKALLNWDEPHLHILTPMGILGSPCVSSGPVVEEILSASSANAFASVPEDRRRILNYISGEEELAGLRVVGSGKLVFDEKYPQGDYEKSLLESRKDSFENLDNLIHGWMKGPEQKQSWFKNRTNNVKNQKLDPSDCGLTLAQLRTMWRQIRTDSRNWERIGREKDNHEAGEKVDRSDSPLERAEKITVYDFMFEVIKKGTPDELKMSYSEHVTESTQQEPEYFINAPYSLPMHETVAAIEWHAEARNLPDTTVYWAWFFSFSVAGLTACFKSGRWPTEFVINKRPQIEGVLFLLDMEASTLQRPNPVFELYEFFHDSTLSVNRLDIACRSGILASRMPFAAGGYHFGDFDVTCAAVMGEFDVTKLSADTPGMKMKKMEVLRTIAGKGYSRNSDVSEVSENETDSPGYMEFNHRVRRLGAGPCLCQAAADGDEELIERIVSRSATSLNAPQIAGVSGEMPLAVATAHGCLGAMQTLLRLQADPNWQDTMGESPLHYAALAGNLEAAKLLVHCGARVDLASTITLERPSKLAALNPGLFLGTDSREVLIYLLQEEWLARRLHYHQQRKGRNDSYIEKIVQDCELDGTTVFLPKTLDGVQVLQQDRAQPRTWQAVKPKGWKHTTPGIEYRKTKLGGIDPKVSEYVPWGTFVEGDDDGEGWVKCRRNDRLSEEPVYFESQFDLGMVAAPVERTPRAPDRTPRQSGCCFDLGLLRQ